MSIIEQFVLERTFRGHLIQYLNVLPSYKTKDAFLSKTEIQFP